MSLLPPLVVEKLRSSLTGLAPPEGQVWSPTLVRPTLKVRVWLAAQLEGAAEMSNWACQWLLRTTATEADCLNQNWWSLNIVASRYIDPVVAGAVTSTLSVTQAPAAGSDGSAKAWLVFQ